jgi:D-alanine transaminase
MPAALPFAYLHATTVAAGFVPIAEARISPLDRGFLFGDAVYEVMPVYGGRVFAHERHIKRLARSLRELALPDPYSAAHWGSLIEGLVARNGGGDQLVYLQVSRGTDAGRDHRFPKGLAPTVFMSGAPYTPPTAALYEKGGRAITQPDIRWGRCDIKTTLLLPNCMARSAADEAGGVEAVLTRGGRALEGTSSTLYIAKSGVLITPPLTHEILPGVTREVLLELAAAAKIKVEERDIPLEALFAADEVMFSNTSAELRPITQVDGKKIGGGTPGKVWRALFEAFQQRKAAEWERPVACALPAESALKYPCKFPIKVMGRRHETLGAVMLEIVARHAGGPERVVVAERASENGNFSAFTFTIDAESQAQVDAIYRELTAHPLVMMAL